MSNIKAHWTVREIGLPAVVRPCVDCTATRHLPTGRFRVNANGKLLDVWLLVGCHGCGRTSKIPVHERVHVSALDWTGTWRLDSDLPFYRPDEPSAPASEVTVEVRFELAAPIRVERLLQLGLGLSRGQVKRMVAAGRIRCRSGSTPRRGGTSR